MEDLLGLEVEHHPEAVHRDAAICQTLGQDDLVLRHEEGDLVLAIDGLDHVDFNDDLARGTHT